MINNDYFLVELLVRNHPGVMSHITGLFARRAFNLEGILCAQVGDGTTSKMFLLVNNNSTLEQIIKQLEKLYDVIEVSLHSDYDQSVFKNFDSLLKMK
jgi:acetolactate synthase-1/3 small subunit